VKDAEANDDGEADDHRAKERHGTVCARFLPAGGESVHTLTGPRANFVGYRVIAEDMPQAETREEPLEAGKKAMESVRGRGPVQAKFWPESLLQKIGLKISLGCLAWPQPKGRPSGT
jgi:hypothetical protein